MSTTLDHREVSTTIKGERSAELADTLMIYLISDQPIYIWTDDSGYCLTHRFEVATACFRGGLTPGGMYREDAVAIVMDWFNGLEDDTRRILAGKRPQRITSEHAVPKGWIARLEVFDGKYRFYSVSPGWV